MSTHNTRSQKRLRETAGSEIPPKRKKLTPNLQLPYDEVKEKSQLLDAELTELLMFLATDEPTVKERKAVEGIQRFLKKMLNTGEVKRWHANVFGQDFDVAFPETMISHLIPGG